MKTAQGATSWHCKLRHKQIYLTGFSLELSHLDAIYLGLLKIIHACSICHYVVVVNDRSSHLQGPAAAVASHEALTQGRPSEHKPGELPGPPAAVTDKSSPALSKSEVISLVML